MVKKFVTRDMIDILRDETDMDDTQIINCLGITRTDLIKLLKGKLKRIEVDPRVTCI